VTRPSLPFPDLVSDPDAALRRARERAPFAETEVGVVAVRHEAARAVLQEPRLVPSFSRFLEQFGVTSGPFYDWMKGSPLDGLSSDDHRRWRKLVMKTFTPRSVERLGEFLGAEAHRLIDAFVDRGRAEFVAEFAQKLPSLGLCELIGVPKEDRHEFSTWADTIGLGFNPVLLPTRIADVDAAITNLLAYADRLVAARRAEPEDDLVTRLAFAADEEGGLGPDRIRGTVAGLVFAGHETTKNQLGWMVALLSDVPAVWDRVAADPAHADDVVEEVLRFRSAATSVGRTAKDDVEILGERIAAGSIVVASLWSANRDADAFAKPDGFDVEANRGREHFAFGHGAHHCLGAALARAELRAALVALASRIRCPRLEPGATYLPPLGINGPTALPIAFERR
jgi:cytochrome P450